MCNFSSQTLLGNTIYYQICYVNQYGQLNHFESTYTPHSLIYTVIPFERLNTEFLCSVAYPPDIYKSWNLMYVQSSSHENMLAWKSHMTFDIHEDHFSLLNILCLIEPSFLKMAFDLYLWWAPQSRLCLRNNHIRSKEKNSPIYKNH